METIRFTKNEAAARTIDVKSRPGRGSRFSIRLYHGVV